MESESEGEKDLSYFHNCFVGVQNVPDSVKESISEATLPFSKGEIDALMQAATPDQLTDLCCDTRELVTSYINEANYYRVNNQEKASKHLKKRIQLESNITTTLKSIPDGQVRDCVARSLSYLSEAFAATLGAGKRVIRNFKEKFAKIIESIGPVAVTCFTIGGIVTTVATGSLAALGLTVVGVAVIALVLYKKCKSKANPNEN